MKLTWYGHGTWLIETGEHRIVLDPFFDDNPSATVAAADVEADYILISHGHFDHVADAAAIANRTDATLVAIYEIAEWFSKNHSVKKTVGMNIGGAIELPFGNVKMTMAQHSSQLPDGSNGGVAAGFILSADSKSIYFACDTGLFSDMRLYQGVDMAVLPIGDWFTMGPADSLEAIKLIEPKQVLPAHYGTWPPIEQDVQLWAKSVEDTTQATPVVLKPGESTTV